jgi:hypothetical protein
MTPAHRLACGLCVYLACSAASIAGERRLTIRVSPAAATAPAFVRVQVTVASDADNRALEVVADSSNFYRASHVPLDGEGAPTLRVFEFPHLPSGVYEMRATLIGSTGERATAATMIQVARGTDR